MRAWGRIGTAIVLLALSACSGNLPTTASHKTTTPTATASPAATPTATASPSAQPQPVSGAYGILVGGATSGQYTVSLVGIDGKIVASANASSPAIASCGGAAGAPVPLPVSASNSRVYMMDSTGAVSWLAPDGTKSSYPSIHLPAPTASRRSMFAVSPDDNYMAVVVADYTASGATTHLYVDELNLPGTQNLIFTQSGAYTLWPIGWHGTNNLVLAVVPSCTQGGGPFCCGPQELHVVDPASATRRFTLGSRTGCVISGPPSPAGVVCSNTPDFAQGAFLNWTAGTVRTLAFNGPTVSYVAPDGGWVAFVDNSGTSFTLGAGPLRGFFACTWIDSTHMLAGGDSQHQARVADVAAGSVVPVQAQGDCGGRLPGGL